MNKVFSTYKYILMLLAVLVILSMSLAVFGDEGDVIKGSDHSGVVYEIRGDGAYAVIIGYNEDFPKIEIPAEVEGVPVIEIGKNAFTNNRSLYSVVIPDSVKTIGEDAFRGCRSLVSVTLPSALTELPMNCFFDCAVLKNIILPESLVRIGDFCFEGCTKLGMLKIPASVTEIGYDAFVHCENIYLDVSENEYAAEYALEYNVNTDYKGTSQYFWTVIGISVGIALVVFFIISMIYLGYLKRNPEKNPNIFIFRVLGKVYEGLAWFFNGLWAVIIWVLSHILYAVTSAIKYLKLRFGKDKRRPKDREPDIDERRE